MLSVVLHRDGQTYEGLVNEQTNLVVRAGIKQFPHPNLRFGCGMGTCAKCACRVVAGAEHLAPPNWKEKKQLGEWLKRGYRLMCQIWLTHDIELAQDRDPITPGSRPEPGRTDDRISANNEQEAL